MSSTVPSDYWSRSAESAPNRVPDRVTHVAREGFESYRGAAWVPDPNLPGFVNTAHTAGKHNIFAGHGLGTALRIEHIAALAGAGLRPLLDALGYETRIAADRNDVQTTNYTLATCSLFELVQRGDVLFQQGQSSLRLKIFTNNDGLLKPRLFAAATSAQIVPIGISQNPFESTLHDVVDHIPARYALGNEFNRHAGAVAYQQFSEVPPEAETTDNLEAFVTTMDALTHTKDVLGLFDGDSNQIEGWQGLLGTDRTTILAMRDRQLGRLAALGCENS
ncbi:MAG TPA: hypothetical protein VLI54_02425 [Bacillota bacterium]|nr:hypothetical protein [Bacillota bacterium]